MQHMILRCANFIQQFIAQRNYFICAVGAGNAGGNSNEIDMDCFIVGI
jgi:hypothetical protein